jgi:ferritin-like metal-binding protein YciE
MPVRARVPDAMSVSSLHDLFVHDLEDVYYAENELLDALSKLAEQTDDEEIAQAFRDHREETEGHVDRLDQVFEKLGQEPEREECEGIEGLITEHEEFLEMDSDQDVLDLHNLVAAQKTEHYEIAAYGNLAVIADRLGEDEIGDILHETLEEEEAALDKVATLTEEFDIQRMTGAASDD